MIRFTTIQLIRLYQVYLSPRKGYRCAYGVCYGSSCSNQVMQIVHTAPIWQWPSQIRQQFRACTLAYDSLKAHKRNVRRRKNRLNKHHRKNNCTPDFGVGSADCCDADCDVCEFEFFDCDICGFDIS